MKLFNRAMVYLRKAQTCFKQLADWYAYNSENDHLNCMNVQ